MGTKAHPHAVAAVSTLRLAAAGVGLSLKIDLVGDGEGGITPGAEGAAGNGEVAGEAGSGGVRWGWHATFHLPRHEEFCS